MARSMKLAALAAAVVGLFTARRAQASAPASYAPQDFGAGIGPQDFGGPVDELPQVQPIDTRANELAMLDVIAWAEGTAGRGDYRTCYGYRHQIKSFAEHPAVTGEWRGEPLDSLGPRYVGKVSTAAGRYQINAPTWADCKRGAGLVDFSPDSQDAAAMWLIKRAGALPDVQQGRLASAVAKLRGRWASLPGAGADQPERSLDQLAAVFEQQGGRLA